MKMETWKSIAGCKGRYEVSDLGRVRSLNYLGNTGKIKVLSPGINRGYLMVDFTKDGKRKKLYVHRLVYETFHGTIPPDMTVDHINGIKTDNRLENLQLLTRGDNARKGRNNSNKQLDLMLTEWPYTELTFSNSCEASAFFGYKQKGSVGDYIYKARKRGKNFITIRNKKYFFARAD